MINWFKISLIGLSFWLAASSTLAQTHYVSVFLGQFDVGRSQADSQYGTSWLSPSGWTRWELKPEIGVLRTRYGSHLVFAGIHRRTPFFEHENGLGLTIGLAPALYWHGGNADTDLGSRVQFKSSIGIDYQFPDATRIAISYAHISNASLGRTNPGTELWTVQYALPF